MITLLLQLQPSVLIRLMYQTVYYSLLLLLLLLSSLLLLLLLFSFLNV